MGAVPRQENAAIIAGAALVPMASPPSKYEPASPSVTRLSDASSLKPVRGSISSLGKPVTSTPVILKAASTVFFHWRAESRQIRDCGSAAGPAAQLAAVSTPYQ